MTLCPHCRAAYTVAGLVVRSRPACHYCWVESGYGEGSHCPEGSGAETEEGEGEIGDEGEEWEDLGRVG